MADWYSLEDTDSGRDGSFSVAGYREIGGDWVDVENGGQSLEASATDVWELDTVTVHYVNDLGDDIYYTIGGPWSDWDSMVEFVEYGLDGYGISE